MVDTLPLLLRFINICTHRGNVLPKPAGSCEFRNGLRDLLPDEPDSSHQGIFFFIALCIRTPKNGDGEADLALPVSYCAHILLLSEPKHELCCRRI